MRTLFFALILVWGSGLAFGQNQLGFGWSTSYGGVHAALANPASLGLTHLKTQFCIAGGDVGLGSNFLKIKSGNGGRQFLKVLSFGPDLVDAVNGEGTQDPSQLLEDNFARKRFGIVLNGKSKNLNLSSELRGPAVLMGFNKGAVCVYYRARAAFQVRDMAEPLARLIYPGLKDFSPNLYGKGLPDNRFNLGANLFHEIGASFGGRIFDLGPHHLSVGGGLRYVMGLYSLDVSNRGLNLTVESADSVVAVQSDVRYTYTNGRYLSQASGLIPKALGRGISLDMGVMYEMTDENYDGPGTPGVSKHKLRVGASMVDLGAVFYSSKQWVRASKLGKTNTAVSWGHLDTVAIRNELDLDSAFRQTFGLDQYNTRFTTYMPMALQLMADYNVYRNFYVSFQTVQSMRAKSTPGMRRFTTFAIAPRYETGIFEASIPIGLGMGGGIFQAGFFVRVGGFYIGSDNILAVTGLSSRGMNFYMGGFIPLRRKAS